MVDDPREMMADRRQSVSLPAAWRLTGYTQMLDDRSADDRSLGMRAGFAWHEGAEVAIAGIDYGISSGMRAGMSRARELGLEVIEVTLKAEMGAGPFADKMVHFERMVHRQTVDHEGQRAIIERESYSIAGPLGRGGNDDDSGPAIGGA